MKNWSATSLMRLVALGVITLLLTWAAAADDPAYVVEVAKVLAETRGVSLDEISRQTTENFFRLFSKVPRAGG